MSFRHLFYIGIISLSIYAWKDWFMGLCGLILMMAVIHYENMPTTMYGIQGLNPWNFLFVVTFLAWRVSRRHEGLSWDMPRHINVLLLMYLGVILVGSLRSVFDRSYIKGYSVADMISEQLINSFKWILLGIMLFDGCRTRRRLIMVVVCLLVMYLLIAAQVIKRMPFESAFGNIAQQKRLVVCDRVGYSACDISTFLAGASWAILATLPLVRKKKYWVMVLVAAGMVTFGQALTGGRAGYMAWGATGLVLCLLKWRKCLILAPVVVILLPIIFPGAVERMLTGFGQIDVAGESAIDDYSITSGRTQIWPYVINKIGESPLIGHGRLAMQRTGLTDQLISELNEGFGHPHNMYLETLLDNGILGSIPILLFWAILVVYAGILFRSSNRLFSAVGGLALSMILAQLFAGLGSQHFYPTESTLGMWAAMFLALRVYVEKKRLEAGAINATILWNIPAFRPQATITADGA